MTHSHLLRSSFTRRAASALATLIVAACLLACDSTSEPAVQDFSGTWSAQISANNGAPFLITLTLTQAGDQLTGTFTNGSFLTGSIDGTATEDGCSFHGIQNPPCPGTFEGYATLVTPDAFEGTYSGNGCTGPFSATMTATRT